MYPPPDFERKLCLAGEVASRAAELPRPLVFTNGCFDVLHRGHVTYLAQARALGAFAGHRGEQRCLGEASRQGR